MHLQIESYEENELFKLPNKLFCNLKNAGMYVETNKEKTAISFNKMYVQQIDSSELGFYGPFIRRKKAEATSFLFVPK